MTGVSAEFTEWMRPLGLADDPEALQQRSAAIAALLKKATYADVDAMVRISFGAKQGPSQEMLTKLVQAFKAVDDSFDPKRNARELQLLCSATLESLLDKYTLIGAAAALAVTTASFDETRRAEWPRDLAAVADGALSRFTRAAHARPALIKSAFSGVKVSFEKAAVKVREGQDFNTVATGFELAATQVESAFSTLTTQLATAIDKIQGTLKAQDEELQMLWWLIGERSWTMSCPFSSVPMASRPLVFGLELGDATETLPGPASIPALISRAGVSGGEELSIPTAVNSCSNEWLASAVEGRTPSPLLHPIQFAITRKLETGDDTSWIAGWSAATSIPHDRTLDPIKLGVLFYRERILAEYF